MVKKIKKVYNKEAGRRNRGFGKTKSEAKAPQNYSDSRPLKCIKVGARNGKPAYTYCNKNLRQNAKNAKTDRANTAKSERIVKQEKQQKKGEAKKAIKPRQGFKPIGTFLSTKQPQLSPPRKGRPPKAKAKGLSVSMRVGGEIVKPKKTRYLKGKSPEDAEKKRRKLNKDGTPRKVRADKGKKRK